MTDELTFEQLKQHRELNKRANGYYYRRNIACCTSGPLVYVRNLKCASTFFWNNLTQTWNWQEITWESIDWKHQRVFGHIMEPMRRRIKGMAEYLHMTDMAEEFRTNPRFQEFLLNVPALDPHSSSYHDFFGNLAWHIDWIPLHEHDHHRPIELTEKLLYHYGHRVLGRWNHGWAHEGTTEKQATENLLNKLITIGRTLPEQIAWYYHNDIELWKRVNARFNPNGGSWPKISWLEQPTTAP